MQRGAADGDANDVADVRPSDKSPDAFRTISEVADHLDLPQHVLRFWETKFSEIRPVKRAGGRRFYRPDDVDLLRAIRHLLYSEGYTIKGVQRILKDNGVRQVQSMGADLLDGPASVPVPHSLSEAAPSGEGGRSGILGLLPRRKDRAPPAAVGEGDEEAVFSARPGSAEPGEPHFDAFLPGFEAPVPAAEPRTARRPASQDDAPPDIATREAEFDDTDFEAGGRSQPQPRRPAREAPILRAEPAAMQEQAPSRPAPALRRPLRGPASRVPEPTLPELEDPLLPFFDDDTLEVPVDSISEPLEARIRRLKEAHPPGPPEEYIPARARRRSPEDSEPTAPVRRVGLLTGIADEPEQENEYWDDTGEGTGDRRMPPEPQRHGPPEQYLPPHLRSEPRLAAAPAHPPQPVLSRDDISRLQAALYELGECRRLLAGLQGEGK